LTIKSLIERVDKIELNKINTKLKVNMQKEIADLTANFLDCHNGN